MYRTLSVVDCGVPHKVFVHFLCEGSCVWCIPLVSCMTVDLNMYMYSIYSTRLVMILCTCTLYAYTRVYLNIHIYTYICTHSNHVYTLTHPQIQEQCR